MAGREGLAIPGKPWGTSEIGSQLQCRLSRLLRGAHVFPAGMGRRDRRKFSDLRVNNKGNCSSGTANGFAAREMG